MTFQYYASHPGVTNPEEHRVKYILENFAHEQRKKIHVGKIGTLRDFLKCSAASVDSADGSTLIRHHREKDIGRYMGIIREQQGIKEAD